jgi:hypothetical protein
MNLTLQLLDAVGNVVGISSSIYFVIFIALGMVRISRGEEFGDAQNDEIGWFALILFALWMACKIGTIGL